jgi:hypothetical protein
LLLSVTIQFGLNAPWNIPHIVIACAALAAFLCKVEVFWVVVTRIAVSMMVF